MAAIVKKDNTKGIFLTSTLAKFKKLNPLERFFLTKINSLDNSYHCYAGNDFFADFFDVSNNTCTRIIQKLKDKKLIDVKLILERDHKGGVKSKRIITVLPDTKKDFFPAKVNLTSPHAKKVCAGIWVSIEIWKDKTLSILEKLFYSLIRGFNNAMGCLYSNNEFADILGISRVRAVQIITALKLKGVIRILSRDNGRDNRQAKSIHLSNNHTEPTSKFLESTSKNLESTSKNMESNGLKNGDHINTPINNTQISSTQLSSKADKSANQRLTPLAGSDRVPDKPLSEKPVQELANQFLVEKKKDRRRFINLFWKDANNGYLYEVLLIALLEASEKHHNGQGRVTADQAISFCKKALNTVFGPVQVPSHLF